MGTGPAGKSKQSLSASSSPKKKSTTNGRPVSIATVEHIVKSKNNVSSLRRQSIIIENRLAESSATVYHNTNNSSPRMDHDRVWNNSSVGDSSSSSDDGDSGSGSG